MAKQRDLNAKLDKELTEAGIPHYSEPIYRVSPKTFLKAVRKAKQAAGKDMWKVSLQSFDEYKGKACYLSRDGKVGMCITKDGDVESLFNGGSKGGATGSLIPFAVAHGGKKLDCYGPRLPNTYSHFGAVATGKVKFDPEFAPPGWDGTTPDIVAMYLPKTVKGVIRSYDRHRTVDMTKLKTHNDYDAMLADRNAKMNGKSALLPNMG